MNEADIMAIAVRVLSTRVMVLIALLLNAGVFAWAMSTESWARLAGAAGFAVASWCLLNLKGDSHADPQA